MDASHVVIHLPAGRKRRETRPADMRLAADTRHVVAACEAFDGHLAARTVLDVVPALPLLEQELVLRVAVLTRAALVPLRVAQRADAHQARRALEDRVRVE